MRRMILLLMVAYSAIATANAVPTAPQSLALLPELLWARSYLLHQVLLTEYVSFADAPSLSQKERDKRLTSAQAVALWKRAQFALGAAKTAHQDLGETTTARALLLEQMALVKKKDKKTFQGMKGFEEETDEGLRRTSAAATFQDEATQRFVATSAAATPTCTVSPVFKQKLRDTAAETDTTRLAPVIEMLTHGSPADVRCAVVSWLQEGSDKDRGAARIVVEAASHVPALAQDTTLAILKATLLLASQDYAEALRILFAQQSREAAYRAPYDLVQVIFSRRQSGDGSVHIRGL